MLQSVVAMKRGPNAGAMLKMLRSVRSMLKSVIASTKRSYSQTHTAMLKMMQSVIASSTERSRTQKLLDALMF